MSGTTVLSWKATRCAQCRRVQSSFSSFRRTRRWAMNDYGAMLTCAQKRYHFYQENNRARWPKISDNIPDLESEGSVFKSWRTLLVQPNFPSPAAGISAPTFSIHSTTYNNRVLCIAASTDTPLKSEILIIPNCQQPSYVFAWNWKWEI